MSESPTTPEPPEPLLAPPRMRPLPYVDRLATRELKAIDLIVIHCTELPDLGEALRFGQHIHYPLSGTGNSGHYYIDRDGLVEQWVPLERVAHHVRGFNERSIGIELVNTGRYPDWFHSENQDQFEPYPDVQIDTLIGLLDLLLRKLPSLRAIAGHQDLDTELAVASDDRDLRVPRKRDPGPTFPWERVLAECPLPRVP